MSYTNVVREDCTCEAKSMPVMPEPPMADLMKEVSFLTEQNRQLAHRIRAFLTGVCEEQNERTQEPRCFKEELLKARYEAHCANEELGGLAVELGLP